MGKRIVKVLFSFAAVVVVAALAWGLYTRLAAEEEADRGRDGPKPAPVEVVAVERGTIEDIRMFSGTLEPRAELTVAPRVSGRIESIAVDLGDTVTRGQVLARLDDAEFVQAVAQAEADLAVAVAQQKEAENALQVARREFDRVKTLSERGVASESQLDTLNAQRLARESELQVASAQVRRAESNLEAARIRLGYATINATWAGDGDQRVVGERFLDEGNTVSVNEPILSVVQLDPITAVMFVTEKDYGQLKPEQAITLTTDAFAGETFEGRISRISPVFRMASRQARVELQVANPDYKLKPGMFVRARVELEQVDDATIVPAGAVVKRSGQQGVFVVSDDGQAVNWQPVVVGIRQGDRTQITSANGDSPIEGRVVTLGLQLVKDGSPILIPEMATPSAEEVERLAAEATRGN